MKKRRNQSHEAEADSATKKLMSAHNEIITAWFDRWATEERSRIDLAFKRSSTAASNKQVA
ncbi:hypothetical protein ACVIGA_004667 [Bradyrhizobium sp. USDA 3240]